MRIQLLGFVLAACAASPGAAETSATAMLKARSVELEPTIVNVSNGVYTAVGYGVSTISMIVGEGGIIIVDAGNSPDTTSEALAAFRKVSTLPIVLLIYTHGHLDHFGGAQALVEDSGEFDVLARSNFGSEGAAVNSVGLTINRVRGARQAGMQLPMESRINNGIAPAVKPFGGFNESRRPLLPTTTFDELRVTLNIVGIEIEVAAAPGETADQLYVWLPESEVLFAGDNFYRSWPNLYAIRGTGYRDVSEWIGSLNMMLAESPEHLVGGHTRPVLGKTTVATTLTNYRDAIQFVFDKTIEGMNAGLTPDELVAYVEVPAELASNDYLLPYYGHPDWAVRAIFDGHLGWFDGNASNLFPLPPRDHAMRIADLAGGPNSLTEQAQSALSSGDHQWAAQLADHLLALDTHDAVAMRIKASALEMLAENTMTATGRNYYLTQAQELRKSAEQANQ